MDKVLDELETVTTRRTVLGTGAKLAYTAPLIAASFKLSAQGAGAVSVDPECDGATCDTFRQCSSTNGDCVCVTTKEGGLCVPGSTSCSVVGPCDNGACPEGSICAFDTCCGEPVCVPIVLTFECPRRESGDAKTNGGRQKTGPGTIGG